MPVLTRTRIDKYYRITFLSAVHKLLELKENDEVKWIFKNGLVYVRKER